MTISDEAKQATSDLSQFAEKVLSHPLSEDEKYDSWVIAVRDAVKEILGRVNEHQKMMKDMQGALEKRDDTIIHLQSKVAAQQEARDGFDKHLMNEHLKTLKS